MSVEDKLRLVAASALENLFSSRAVSAPISSFDLLARIIALGPSPGLFPDHAPPPRFRLIDLARLERILEHLSEKWENGKIVLSREENSDGGLTVMDVQLGIPSHDQGDRLPTSPVRRKRKRVVDEDDDSAAGGKDEEETPEVEKPESWKPPPSTLDSLNKTMKEVYALVQQSSAKGKLLAEQVGRRSIAIALGAALTVCGAAGQFRSILGSFEPICPQITKDECTRARREYQTPTSPSKSMPAICDRIHFRPLLRPHTDPALGHCSYLNTCYSEPTYAQSPSIPPLPSHRQMQYGAQGQGPVSLPSGLGAGGRGKEKAPCRYLHSRSIGIFDYSVLGKFHVIMADPPWDIHMSLPYGTMTDDEMRAMPIPTLQDEGLLFLWVTGRAMEVGRECLRVWGYTRVDEVVWVKTNQLQRVIRTGRTGHWLNHTKEHMLVGVKTVTDEQGNLKFPSWVNRGLDTDVVVSEVRETSRKPDEVYGMIERMCPGGRKIEIFGRKHNTRPGWLTLGNQLGADQIYEEDLRARIKARYPERNLNPPPDLGH
uniref:mRNA m(6)A methyltransferase n=1 Tax=Ganoderma boninense TaxID=34458 RepID=A0A5K1JXI9_9APHY|nr:Zn(2)-C6 fungal-type domain-containing protein [Ganoderma boninense]